MDCNSSLPFLLSRPVRGDFSNPGSVAVQVSPFVYTSFFWLVLELATRRRRTSVWPLSFIVLAASTSASSLFTWILFDDLSCTEYASADQWRGVAVVTPSAVALLIFLFVSRRFPRAAAFASLSVAAGCFASEWVLRRVLDVPSAARSLFILQTVWCIITVCYLSNLPPKLPFPSRTSFEVMDPLA